MPRGIEHSSSVNVPVSWRINELSYPAKLLVNPLVSEREVSYPWRNG